MLCRTLESLFMRLVAVGTAAFTLATTRALPAAAWWGGCGLGGPGWPFVGSWW
jgi:hypothetical protein